MNVANRHLKVAIYPPAPSAKFIGEILISFCLRVPGVKRDLLVFSNDLIRYGKRKSEGKTKQKLRCYRNTLRMAAVLLAQVFHSDPLNRAYSSYRANELLALEQFIQMAACALFPGYKRRLSSSVLENAADTTGDHSYASKCRKAVRQRNSQLLQHLSVNIGPIPECIFCGLTKPERLRLTNFS